MATSQARVAATTRHRAKRRRVEVLLDPNSDESAALDQLSDKFGSVSKAIKRAIMMAIVSDDLTDAREVLIGTRDECNTMGGIFAHDMRDRIDYALMCISIAIDYQND